MKEVHKRKEKKGEKSQSVVSVRHMKNEEVRQVDDLFGSFVIRLKTLTQHERDQEWIEEREGQ